MKGKERYKEFFEEIRPVTDEELEELLNGNPKNMDKRKKRRRGTA
ncbi:MAG: hypothetical protein QFX40_06055 [Archaeoglobales archaeon]|nr:hypothetical protein [Archaeoglobales archaeon]